MSVFPRNDIEPITPLHERSLEELQEELDRLTEIWFSDYHGLGNTLALKLVEQKISRIHNLIDSKLVADG